MNNLAVIGVHNPSIEYQERLTVKALVLNNKDEVLIINDGLLPGGGVEEDDENDITALHRECLEEVGMTISEIKEIGTVIQYRDLIHRKYIIHGYTAHFVDNLGETKPQNEREAAFTHAWYPVDKAIDLINDSIKPFEDRNVALDKDHQSWLFNRLTTLEFLKMFDKSS